MVLATWRVASLLTAEDGPWHIFKRLREFTGIVHHDDGSIAHVPDRKIPRLFECLWCMSIWVGGIIYVIWYFEPIPVWLLAISSGAIIVDRLRG